MGGRVPFQAVLILAENGTAKDIFAVLVGLLAGFAVLLYAASSDLFELKFFKFNPKAFKLPKQTRVEYWYTKSARRVESTLTGGGWSYARFKKWAKVAFSRERRRLRRQARKMLPDAVKRLNRDIALGVLAIAIVLVALILIRLL
jgi:hypothetical protein